MVKRKQSEHEDCLREFGAQFKQTVRENLSFWKNQNQELAEVRAAAFELVRSDLVMAPKKTGVPLQDIGIEDFDVPKV